MTPKGREHGELKERLTEENNGGHTFPAADN